MKPRWIGYIVVMLFLWVVPTYGFHHCQAYGVFMWLGCNGEDPDPSRVFMGGEWVLNPFGLGFNLLTTVLALLPVWACYDTRRPARVET